jgi:AraC-like DNA-binding protein
MMVACGAAIGSVMKAVLRTAKTAPQSLISAARHHVEPLRFSWHYHAQFELVLILSGNGSRQVGTSFEDFKRYDLVLMGPGLPHRYASRRDARTNRSACDFMVVHFDPSLFPAGMGLDSSYARLSSLLSRAAQGVAFNASVAQTTAHLLKDLLNEKSIGRWVTLLRLLDILSEVTDARTLCPVSFLQGQLDAGKDDSIARSCSFVEKNLVRPMSVHEAAAVAGMSASAFSRSFRKSTGLSFVSYVNEMRLRIACLLLTEDERPVKAIAAAVGFPNRSYFHRTFVSHKGVTPTEYRKRSGPQTSSLSTTRPATSVKR